MSFTDRNLAHARKGWKLAIRNLERAIIRARDSEADYRRMWLKAQSERQHMKARAA